MDNVSDNDTLETNHDSVLNEDHDGDDELKENGVDSQDESKTKRRSRRVIRVEEENDEATDVSEKLSRRIQRQSSSEDEVVRNRNRTRTASSTSNERRSRHVPSSSEDDIISPRRKDSKISVKDRTSSFEQSSSTENTIGKRGSFARQKSHTVATSGAEEQKRDRFSRNRTISSDQDGMKSPRKTSPQKTSEDRPEWSSSTKVEHERVLTHTVSRKESTTRTNRVSRQESTTHSESDEPKSAAQLKAKWESRASGDNKVANRTKAFGGSTGAAAMRARFENTSSTNYKRRTSSSSQPRNRLASGESVDGEQNTPRHSAASLKARFEAKQADSTPVKRNFVINKGKAAGVAKKFGAANASNKCAVCNKTVYPMEKLEAEGVPYHKFCFKCATCSRTVSLGNYAALEGKIYCKPHLKQLFKLKGNYDEGFGRAQRKADWVNKDANTKSFDTEVESKQQENGSEVNGHDPDTREEVTVNGYDE